MNNKVFPEKKGITIDMLLPTAGKGGVEMVVSKTAVYLQSIGYRVRVVQLCFFGDLWLDPSIEFYPLLNAPMNELLDSIGLYEGFVKKHGAPNLLLTVTFPALVVAGKEALNNLGFSSIPVVSWLHAPLEEYAQNGAGGLGSLFYGDANFVISQKVLNQVEACFPEKRNYLISNPIEFYKCNTLKTLPDDPKCLLYVGRLSIEKRLDIILKAIGACNYPWQIKIIGEGPVEQDLIALVNELSISSRVHFLGWKSNPWEDVSDCSAFILASDYEGFCMAAVEALYTGLPVITPPLDLMQTLILPGENGYIYPNGNIDTLSQILDMYGKKQFPPISTEACRNSVLQYDEKTALNEFAFYIDDVLKAFPS